MKPFHSIHDYRNSALARKADLAAWVALIGAESIPEATPVDGGRGRQPGPFGAEYHPDNGGRIG